MTPLLRAVVRPTLAALVLALVFATLAVPRAAHAGPVDDVCASMQEYAASSSARVGFVVLDLTDGSRCSNRAGEVFRTASLYKLIVLAEAHEQVRQGTFSFDESIAVRRYRAATATRPEGVDVFQLGAREAARRMIQLSDNNTAVALAARLPWSAVGAAPARLGMPNTIVGDAYTTTADDIAYFFAELHAGTLVGADEDAAMLEVLRGQLIRDRIPWFLPGDVEIAHKTGRLYAYANDAGIVYAPAGPFVLVLLTESDASLGPGYEAIRNLARMAYGGFDDDPSTPVVTAPAAATPAPALATPVATATPTPTPSPTPTPTPTTATPNADSDGHANADSDGHANADSDGHANADSDGHANVDSDGHAHSRAGCRLVVQWWRRLDRGCRTRRDAPCAGQRCVDRAGRRPDGEHRRHLARAAHERGHLGALAAGGRGRRGAGRGACYLCAAGWVACSPAGTTRGPRRVVPGAPATLRAARRAVARR